MDDGTAKLRNKRSSVIMKALVRSAGVPEGVERRVRNLSVSGACIDHMGELSPGDPVTLMMGTLAPTSATVAWATERLAGVQFEHEVNVEAARMRRESSAVLTSGWMADMNHAYRKAR